MSETEIVSHETICKCGMPNDSKGQRVCKSCHATYMRTWRVVNFEKKIQKAVKKRIQEMGYGEQTKSYA